MEVGRIWQFGLLVARGFRPLLDDEPRYGLADDRRSDDHPTDRWAIIH